MHHNASSVPVTVSRSFIFRRFNLAIFGHMDLNLFAAEPFSGMTVKPWKINSGQMFSAQWVGPMAQNC